MLNNPALRQAAQGPAHVLAVWGQFFFASSIKSQPYDLNAGRRCDCALGGRHRRRPDSEIGGAGARSELARWLACKRLALAIGVLSSTRLVLTVDYCEPQVFNVVSSILVPGVHVSVAQAGQLISHVLCAHAFLGQA